MFRNPNEVEQEVNKEEDLEYILITGKPPLLLQKVKYYNAKMFRGKYRPDPTFS
jgi:type IV secretory pathway TraG/TraD family ATPase VirD4